MGFKDTDGNLAALMQVDGDLNRALELLLSHGMAGLNPADSEAAVKDVAAAEAQAREVTSAPPLPSDFEATP